MLFNRLMVEKRYMLTELQKITIAQIDDCDQRIKDQEKVCADSICGKFGNRPIDLDINCCNSPNPKYNDDVQSYECQTCGFVHKNSFYTRPVIF